MIESLLYQDKNLPPRNFARLRIPINGDKNQQKEPTAMLTLENVHVTISVSIGDTLKREPTHICDKDPAELICKFMEELEIREKIIWAKVKAESLPEGADLLPKTQRGADRAVVQRCSCCWF